MKLTAKANRSKGDGRGFIRAGVMIPATWTSLELDTGQALAIRAEAARPTKIILVADDMKPAEIVDIISRLKSVGEIKVLAAAKSSANVQKAAEGRIAELAPVTEKDAKTGLEPSPELLANQTAAFMKQIDACTTLEGLQSHDEAIENWKDKDTHKQLADAYAKRKLEIAGPAKDDVLKQIENAKSKAELKEAGKSIMIFKGTAEDEKAILDAHDKRHGELKE